MRPVGTTTAFWMPSCGFRKSICSAQVVLLAPDCSTWRTFMQGATTPKVLWVSSRMSRRPKSRSTCQQCLFRGQTLSLGKNLLVRTFCQVHITALPHKFVGRFDHGPQKIPLGSSLPPPPPPAPLGRKKTTKMPTGKRACGEGRSGLTGFDCSRPGGSRVKLPWDTAQIKESAGGR